MNFWWENKKNIITLLSAEYTHRVVNLGQTLVLFRNLGKRVL